ncbi:Lar-like restriction alleviation protein [Vibrio phage PS15B-6]|nr:hypothetical protein MYOV066v1_p0048 [Vibrio phage PS15B.3]QZI90885.1 hypothetical protein MYOV064v1_p0035 [Vibrio phage PS15B.4]
MEDLKNCPFCDCEMEIVSVGRDWWRIKPVDGHEDACPFGEFHEWDCSQQKPEWKDEHIADWNKRTDDRLVEENAQQSESLEAFRKLVKAQTQTMKELNERCKEIEKEKARLRFALHKARQGYKNLIELRALPNTGWNGEAQDLIDLCDDALE